MFITVLVSVVLVASAMTIESMIERHPELVQVLKVLMGVHQRSVRASVRTVDRTAS